MQKHKVQMKSGRPRVFNEGKALDSAIEVFCRKGYEAASTEALQRAMKLGKSSMYNAFGSKKNLFVKAINRYVDDYLINFSNELAASDRPIELIKKFFTSIAEKGTEQHLKGCFLGNSIVGLSGIDQSMARKATTKLMAIEELFFIHILRAQSNGQMKHEGNPKVIAKHLITLWNGLNVTRRMYPDSAVLSELIDFQLQILD
jgi:TetR/AcrR family transcriptional regulator, transcriptional repressor for nem operon